jgi:molybdopterin/thiamine biosynthesis adenylyltransferase
MSERRAFLKSLVAATKGGQSPLSAAGADATDATEGGQSPLSAAGADATDATEGEQSPLRAAGGEATKGGLTPLDVERYSRQLVLPEWSEAAQRALADASVLVVGAGALGSPVATYLAGAGVGRLGIVDHGDVELSNLHRQHLHFTPDLGVPKAHSAVAKLAFLNPEIVIEPYQAAFTPAMVEGQDLVVDCTDSFEARYAVNAACCAAAVPLVEAGVVGMSGLVMAIRPGESACYRCAFPQPPPAGGVPTCAQAGVLGPAAGVIGSLQALEALKLLAGVPGALTDAFLQVDLATSDFLRVAVRRRADCPDCASA